MPAAPPAPTATSLPQPPDLPPSAPLVLDVSGLPYKAAERAIFQSAAPESVKAQALLGLLKQVPEEGLASITEQAAAWLRDRDYATSAAPILTDPATHGQVLSALFADLLERPDGIALPTLLQIARTPTHPFAPSARDTLALLLDHNFGSDWGAWDQAVRERLRTPGR